MTEGTQAAAVATLTPWSAILVVVTLAIVFGGITLFLAVVRRRA